MFQYPMQCAASKIARLPAHARRSEIVPAHKNITAKKPKATARRCRLGRWCIEGG